MADFPASTEAGSRLQYLQAANAEILVPQEHTLPN